MRKLIVQRNQLNYVGIFSEPALSLWGEGKKIFQGLFTAFSPYQIDLDDLSNDSSSPSPSDQLVAVKFGTIGEYRFKFDRVELNLFNFTRNSIFEVPKLLSSGEEWLRSVVPGFAFRSHSFASLSHSELQQGTSQEFLRGLSSIDIPGIGVTEGSGIIFHWDLPDKGWRVQFTIDHSISVANGLFTNFLIRPSGDRVDYVNFVADGMQLFERVFLEIGLEVDEGAPEHS